jgi:hypothetical protein
MGTDILTINELLFSELIIGDEVITPDRELMELVRGQVEATTRLIDRQERFLDQVVKVTDDHEKRLRILERTIGYGLGFAGAVTLLVTMLRH